MIQVLIRTTYITINTHTTYISSIQYILLEHSHRTVLIQTNTQILVYTQHNTVQQQKSIIIKYKKDIIFLHENAECTGAFVMGLQYTAVAISCVCYLLITLDIQQVYKCGYIFICNIFKQNKTNNNKKRLKNNMP